MSILPTSNLLNNIVKDIKCMAARVEKSEKEEASLKRKLEDCQNEIRNVKRKVKDEMIFRDFLDTRMPEIIVNMLDKSMESEMALIVDKYEKAIDTNGELPSIPYKTAVERDVIQSKISLVSNKKSIERDTMKYGTKPFRESLAQ